MRLRKKIFIITGSTLFTILILLPGLAIAIIKWFVLPPEKLTPIVLNIANPLIEGVIECERIELTFMKTFPRVGLKLDNGQIISHALRGIAEIESEQENPASDTLLRFSTAIVSGDIMDYLRRDRITIDRLFIEDPYFYGLVLEDGRANWDILPSEDKLPEADTTGFKLSDLDLQRIKVTGGHFIYEDCGADLYLETTGFDLTMRNTRGKGQLNVKIKTKFESLVYESPDYILENDIRAEFESVLDLSRGRIEFGESKLLLNDIPFATNGFISSSDGNYDMDIMFSFSADNIAELLKFVPDEYFENRQNITAKGAVNLRGNIHGTLNDSVVPVVNCVLQVNKGALQPKNSTHGIQRLDTDIDLLLDLNDLAVSKVKITTLNIDGTNTSLRASGRVDRMFTDPEIYAKIKGNIDFEGLVREIMNPDSILVRGKMEANIETDFRMSEIMEGNYSNLNAAGSIDIERFIVADRGAGMGMRLQGVHFHADTAHTESRFLAKDDLFSSTLVVDSISFRSRDGYDIRVRNLDVVAKTSRTIDTTAVIPLTTTVKMSGLRAQLPDSIWIAGKDITIAGGIKGSSGNARQGVFAGTIVMDSLWYIDVPERTRMVVANPLFAVEMMPMMEAIRRQRQANQSRLATVSQQPRTLAGAVRDRTGSRATAAGGRPEGTTDVDRTTDRVQAGADTGNSGRTRPVAANAVRGETAQRERSARESTGVADRNITVNDTGSSVVDTDNGAPRTGTTGGNRRRNTENTIPGTRPETGEDTDSRRERNHGSENGMENITASESEAPRGQNRQVRPAREQGGFLRNWEVRGSVRFNSMRLFTALFPIPLSMEGTTLRFDTDKITLTGAKARAGKSDFTLDGEISGMRMARMRNGMLTARLTLESDYLDCNQLLRTINRSPLFAENLSEDDTTLSAAIENAPDIEAADMDDADWERIMEIGVAQKEQSDEGIFVVPANIDLVLKTTARKVDYDQTALRNIEGEIIVRNQSVNLRRLNMESDLGSGNLTMVYTATDKSGAEAGFELEMDNIIVEELIRLFPAMDSLMPMLRSFEGVVDCQISATCRIDSAVNIVLPSLHAACYVTGENMVLMDGETFAEISKKLMFKNKKRNLIDYISVDLLIKDNVIEVFPFMVEIDRYKLGVGGVHNLDMTFDYHISVMKSPVPFKLGLDIRGNLDDFKFKIVKCRYKNLFTPAREQELEDTRLNLRSSIRESILGQLTRNAPELAEGYTTRERVRSRRPEPTLTEEDLDDDDVDDDDAAEERYNRYLREQEEEERRQADGLTPVGLKPDNTENPQDQLTKDIPVDMDSGDFDTPDKKQERQLRRQQRRAARRGTA